MPECAGSQVCNPMYKKNKIIRANSCDLSADKGRLMATKKIKKLKKWQ